MQIKDLPINKDKKTVFVEFHNELLDLFLNQTSGDTQLISKMKAYWEYFALSFSLAICRSSAFIP